MKRWQWITGLVVVVGIAAAVFLLQSDGQGNGTATPSVQRVVSVERGNLELTVSADGVVRPINKVEVKSKASGQIVELNIVEGQAVQKGELLIALDQTTTLNDHEQAKADLELAQVSAMQQENNYKRSLELFQKALISEQERDLAHVDVVRAKSTLVKARAALSSAEERLRDTRIKAPISGIVLTKDVEGGQIISSGVSNVGGGTLLATLADMNEVYVETSVDEVDIGNVSVGQGAKVVADAFPDETFQGEVVRIAPLGKTEQTVTVFQVLILVRNRGGMLKAGMSASVEIQIFSRTQALLVPSEALKDPRSEQGKAFLAMMQRDSSADSSRHAARAGGLPGGAEGGAAMRERMASASPGDREKMQQQFQERLQNLSPQERQRFMELRRQWTDGGGGGSAGRSRRGSQVTSQQRSKRRIALVKEGDEFVPRIITIGVSNFDYAEVLGGLEEGDQVLVSTTSRALISAQEFRDRLSSRTSVGGIGGGRR